MKNEVIEKHKKNILYIHGFNSSPQSLKAQQTKQYLSEYFPDINFYCPQIKSSPTAAIAQLTQILKSNSGTWSIMGSSLGGYFSTYLSEKYQYPAVIINPAVRPFELLNDYLGEQTNPYTNEVYTVTEQYIDDLKALEQQEITKKHYLVMVQTGDEVLDYQQAVNKYQQCQLIVQQGGDHSFVNYSELLPKIAQFFKL
ncbi:YqiA/YcfP family alpha/beta fold hydrolase [Thalassotalea profundi]|uniref:Esterase YqiA n=1 Tax=Thalassotalea profundi TaxID=2036687 RepID=A0ABQ3IM41_9GAMM|nr:YqiA/YcfP family alpha/beta fold hydrolase [Thalassotalea profundi]GHE84312.1 esterase YqiA [Thalassotalea profundi]